MISAALLALAVAAPAGLELDAYVGEDGCRYVRRPRAAAIASTVRRSFVMQFARPASAPASAPKKAKRKPAKREEVPVGFDRLCDEGAPLGPLATIMAPPLFATASENEPPAPHMATEAGPELSAPVLLSDLPASEGLAGPAWPPASPAWPPVTQDAPVLVYAPTPAAPEPSSSLLLLAGIVLLALLRHLRR